MKHGIIAVFLLSWISICFADPDFVGIYKCKGFDPYLDKAYHGTIQIFQQNTVYSLKMQYDTGERSVGTAGLFDDNTISVVFQNVRDLKQVGLERYSYSDDHKKIQGYWVYLGQDKLGKEVCKKIASNTQAQN